MFRSKRLLISICGLLVFASRSHGETPTLSPDQLQPGQKAVVKTVFEGQKIESFDAEIVGVLKGGASEGDMILARATTDRVKQTGIAQGMSGSPVYVDGKLVGALSGGWSFTREPLFVVTPIGEMLGTFRAHTEEPGEGIGTTGPGGLDSDPDAGFGAFRWPGEPEDPPVTPQVSRPLAQDNSVLGSPTPLAVPVSCVGLHAGLLPLATKLLQPLGLTAVPGGGSGPAAGSAPFEPGSAVAVELMRGDLRLAAIGTVTWREGNRVLIFGHPFFQAGAIRLPLSSASITTIVASDLVSFKLGSAGAPVGTATQDRRAAVAGTVGATPHLLPVSVVVANGGRTQAFHYESIEDRSMAPQLLSLAAANSWLESGGTSAAQTARWTLSMYRKGAKPLVLSDVVVSENPVGDLQGGLAAPLRFLYNNPFTRLALDSVAVRIDAVGERSSWSLRSARILEPVVRPGGEVHVRCDLERWRGDHETATFSLRMPEEVPAGRYLLWVGGGPELSRREATRLPGRYRPSSLDEAWRRLSEYRPSDRLHAALYARAPEVTRSGWDYPELPTSALALLAGGQEAEDAVRRGTQATLDHVERRFAGPIHGELQLEVEVDPGAP